MNMLISVNQRTLSLAILFLRLMTGLILFVAGAGKAMGWFGGMGITATLQAFEAGMHISAGWAYLSTYAELLGGLFVMIGFLTRPAALALTINMVVATIVTGPDKFFMGGGAFPCLLAVCSFVILLSGPMRYSIDALLWKNRKANTTATHFA